MSSASRSFLVFRHHRYSCITCNSAVKFKCKCEVVMPSVAYVTVCLSVCPVCALTFESFDVETSFLVWGTSSEYLGPVNMSSCGVEVKVTQATKWVKQT